MGIVLCRAEAEDYDKDSEKLHSQNRDRGNAAELRVALQQKSGLL